MQSLSTELRYLLYVGLLQLVIWVPYILAHLNRVGVSTALGYRVSQDMPDWAHRLKAAHYNLVENLVPFAAVVVAGEFVGVHTAVTHACAVIFFLARIAHPIAAVAQVWGTRTVAFAVGWAATIVYLFVVLTTGA